MNYFHRWNLRVIAALIIMLPILLLLQLLNCIPESPAPAQKPSPKIPKSFDDQVPPPGHPIMKVQNPLMSRFASGTLGHQLIYRRTPRGHAAYLHFKPKQPGTAAQVNHQILFHLLADRWNYFNETERSYFIPEANGLRITPYNAYMQLNLSRLNPAQPTGLIGWWPNIVPAGDVLHDLTSNRNDGEFVSLDPDTAWPTDQVRRGRVIQYDGTGYVNVPDPPSSLTAYTWAFWFKQNAYTATSAIVDTGYSAHYAHARFSAQKTAHVLRLTYAYSPPMFLTDFTWHHYAGAYIDTYIAIWIDGLFITLVPNATAPNPNYFMHFGIHDLGVPPVGFRGRVDDLRFYNRFLQTAEVAELAAW